MKKRIVKYCGYVIYYNTDLDVYMTTLNEDDTDAYFFTIDEVYEAIDSKLVELSKRK